VSGKSVLQPTVIDTHTPVRYNNGGSEGISYPFLMYDSKHTL